MRHSNGGRTRLSHAAVHETRGYKINVDFSVKVGPLQV